MFHSKIFNKLSNFAFVLNKDLVINSVSSNILKSEIKDKINRLSIVSIFSNEILFDNICKPDVKYTLNEYNLVAELENILKTGKSFYKNIYKEIKNEEKACVYSFSISANLISVDEKEIIVNFIDFKLYHKSEKGYLEYFNGFDDDYIEKRKSYQVGRFVIDFGKSKYMVYGDKAFSNLLNIEESPDNFYILTSRHAKMSKLNSIVKSGMFFERSDKLVSGEIELLEDEWLVNDKWLKVEARAIKRDKNGISQVVRGIVYNATDRHEYEELKHVNSIYELAINSGGIGIFYYNIDKYESKFFEANDIYADMIGLDSNEDGFYLYTDFLKAQMELEQEIFDKESAASQAQKIFSGKTDSTHDQILKIKHLKTGYIKYLMTSAKIDERFEDGTARRFGGIIIDITDRIAKETQEREFAYKDVLTNLGNNRKLYKDMQGRKSGIGLFFDLDNFKKINDNFGHLKGDEMIKVFGKALSFSAKKFKNIAIYRLYGDEFFVFAEGKDEKFALKFEKIVKENIQLEMKYIEDDILLEASMGYSLFEEGSDVDDFIKNADYAMYQTKIAKKK